MPFYHERLIEAGCDEAGRGCLAGSVFAAAVIFPKDYENSMINDSKQLSAAKRYKLREIIEKDAIAWGVGIVTPEEIDKINILNSSFLAMHRALDALSTRPEAIIVDGNRFKPYGDIPYQTFVKGDGRFANIAAASILAKTHRDEFMRKIHEEYPMYHWNENKGYPTKAHREAIEKYGPTPYHRMTFTLIDPQLKLF